MAVQRRTWGNTPISTCKLRHQLWWTSFVQLPQLNTPHYFGILNTRCLTKMLGYNGQWLCFAFYGRSIILLCSRLAGASFRNPIRQTGEQAGCRLTWHRPWHTPWHRSVSISAKLELELRGLGRVLVMHSLTAEMKTWLQKVSTAMSWKFNWKV